MLGAMDTFPDLGSLSDQELKDLIQQLTDEEQEVSYRRRILHGKIDILRAELVNRLRKKHEGGEDVISGADVQRLTDILAGRATGGGRRACSGVATAPNAASSSPRARTTARSAARSSARASPATTSRRRPTSSTSRPASCGPVDVGDVAAESGALVIRSGGGRVGQSFPLHGERMTIGRSPDTEIFLDDVTVSRDHAVLVRRSRRLVPRRLGLAERHVRQPPPDRLAQARGRRRAADRQVQAHLSARGERRAPVRRSVTGSASRSHEAPRKSLTIGAVCKALSQEFPDISISKIRYLEDQKLLSPRRTPGGYRLYAQSDVSRLRTILRLQRDEFLPLRVIRQELAAGRADDDAAPRRRAGRRPRRPTPRDPARRCGG